MTPYPTPYFPEQTIGALAMELQRIRDERDEARATASAYWQALIDIAGWENWQDETWREIAQKALAAQEPS